MRPPVPLLVVATLTLAFASAGCDDDAGGDAAEFCTGVASNLEGLRAVPATEEAVEQLIDLWRDVGDSAPLAIEEEWDTLVENLERAWTSDDRQDVLAGAFAAERSAVALAEWLEDSCDIAFGPVATIVAPAPTTTAAVTTTSTTPPG